MGDLVEERPRAAFLADILKALAHPARLRIVAALCDGSASVGAIARRLALPQAIVSQQLRILRMSGLVESVREKGFSRYSLAQPRLRQLVACLAGCQSHGTTLGAAHVTAAPARRKGGAGTRHTRERK